MLPLTAGLLQCVHGLCIPTCSRLIQNVIIAVFQRYSRRRHVEQTSVLCNSNAHRTASMARLSWRRVLRFPARIDRRHSISACSVPSANCSDCVTPGSRSALAPFHPNENPPEWQPPFRLLSGFLQSKFDSSVAGLAYQKPSSKPKPVDQGKTRFTTCWPVCCISRHQHLTSATLRNSHHDDRQGEPPVLGGCFLPDPNPNSSTSPTAAASVMHHSIEYRGSTPS